MTKYHGYYIDGVVFKSKKEIDDFHIKNIKKKICQLNDALFNQRYSAVEKIRIAGMIHDREIILHDEYGLDWEEIENIAFEEV